VQRNEAKLAISAGIFGFIALLTLVLVWSGCTTVDAGYRGVKTRFGNVTGEPLNPGLHFTWPGVESITQIEVREQKFSVGTDAASKDLQMVKAKVAINFAPNAGEVHTLYKTIGLQYQDRIMAPAIEETVKAVTARYTAEELVTKRTEVRAEMMKLLTEKLKTSHISIKAFNIEDFNFSAQFNHAIEAKQKAEQDALRAENELAKEKVEADKKIEEARGKAESVKLAADAEAQAIRARAEAEAAAIRLRGEAEAAAQTAIAKALTPDVIRFRSIEKWNGNVPKFNGVSAIPFLNLTEADKTNK
jgi:regulator of protease activity HflC (stomatin/prohibitin superfamily)